jgi:chemosensory pili system protein ChpA (sensor histidine kinase/response regulator)
MTYHHDQLALRWVKEEVDNTLAQAQQALEAYVAEPEDSTRLTTCSACLHQVRGTLQMLELYGAALLAEEMEQVSEALSKGMVAQTSEALEVLMTAILQLPTYLESMQAGQKDVPLVLLPMLNDLRAARSASLLTESSIFTPDLSSLQDNLAQHLENLLVEDEIKSQVKNLRSQYQRALLAVIRSTRELENLQLMGGLLNQMARLTENFPMNPLWKVAGGFLQAVFEDKTYGSTAVRSLFSELDRQMKAVLDAGLEVLNAPVQEQLLKNLLYNVARSHSRSALIREIQQTFQLDEALPSEEKLSQARDRMSGPDQRVIATVVSAIKEDLAAIKDSLDLYVRKKDAGIDELVNIPSALRRVSDTLALLGLGNARDIIRRQLELVQQMVSGQIPVSDGIIMDVAGSLLFVEATLSNLEQLEPLPEVLTSDADVQEESLVDSIEYAHAREALLHEVRASLQQAKEGMMEFVAGGYQVDILAPVVVYVHQVSQVLRLVNYGQAADILDACGRYMDKQWIVAGQQPDQKSQDNLADALTGVDYFIETLEAGGSGSLVVLEAASESFERLQHPRIVEQWVPSLELPEAESTLTNEDDDAIDLGLEPDDLPELLLEEVVNERLEPPVVLPTAEPISVTPATAVANTSSDDDLIDDEVREIFIEEAEEEIVNINRLQPAWCKATDNLESLKTFRRSYHTLKGSGRLVRALELGELAWSAENLCNRLLDTSLKPEANVLAVLEEIRAILPAMVEAFRKGVEPQVDHDFLRCRAIALSKGQPEPVKPSAAPAPQQQSARPEPTKSTSSEPTKKAPPKAAPSKIDNSLMEIFGEEVQELLTRGDLVLHQGRSASSDLLANRELLSILHTLRGSAQIAGVTALAELVTPLDNLAQLVEERGLMIQGHLADLIGEFFDYSKQQLADWLQAKTGDLDIQQQLLQRISQLRNELLTEQAQAAEGSSRNQLLTQFISQLADGLNLVELLLRDWEQGQRELPARIAEQMRRIQVLAEEATQILFAELAAQAADWYQAWQQQPQTIQVQSLAVAVNEQLLLWADQLVAAMPLQANLELPEQLVVLRPSIPEEPLVGLAAEMQQQELDEELVSIFLDESAEIIAGVKRWLPEASAGRLNPALVELQRLYHTLKGSARMTGIEPIAELGHRLERLADLLVAEPKAAKPQHWLLLERAQVELCRMHAECQSGLPVAEAETQLLEQLDHLELLPEVVEEPLIASLDFSADTVFELGSEVDAELFDLFIEESGEIFDQATETLSQWQTNLNDLKPLAELQRLLHTLKGTARMVGANPVADLAHALEDLYEAADQHRLQVSSGLFELVQSAHDELMKQVESIEASRRCTEAVGLIRQLRSYLGLKAQLEEIRPVPLVIPTITETASASLDLITPEKLQRNIKEALALDAETEETFQIFMVEAEELVDSIGELLQRWSATPSQTEYLANLLRKLHTLKGGARLVNMSVMAEICHGLESMLTRDNLVKLSDDQLELAYEAVEAMRELQRQATTERAQTWPMSLLTKLGIAVDQLQQPAAASAVVVPADASPVDTVADKSSHEFIRVNADLLEDLSNLAGETSIARGRLEQQFAQLVGNLQEMDATVARLREQLRRMEIETETQILSTFRESTNKAYQDFDPLEMDRYSQLHQLSRSLAESAGDLTNIKESMASITSEAETLLIQQARVNSQLQEGMMRARMMPFSSLVPRLRRIVRQISSELGKSINLSISAEGEMDRSVIERLVAPLEHMLRNAIDHGIESQEARKKSGKQVTGQIGIRLFREGSQVVIEIRDDGAGIKQQAVRRKAIERGIISANVTLSEPELLRLIFEPGFSTAEKVTQISGRGVGMDVVDTEIKRLGGTIQVASKEGAGTSFTIKLPFTLSINQALMIGSGAELYAIPLTSVTAIVQLHPTELDILYRNDYPFAYTDKNYKVMHIGELTGQRSKINLEEQTRPLPVLLLKGVEPPVAVQVDELFGTRELTVKTVGMQLSSVAGVSGATIMGDGRVVLLLDLPAVVRRSQAPQLAEALGQLQREQQQPAQIPEEQLAPLIMVVDDSITVRKVTSRLLERNNYRVITARDGVDAVSQLHEQMPDVILMDIEMPRMDGFELAALVRHDERLSGVPIIMITSRTGEKHRDRALSLGVDRYMGKPFKEEELLTNITALLVG